MLVAADHVQGIAIPLLIILIREFLVSGMREFLGPKTLSCLRRNWPNGKQRYRWLRWVC